MNWIVDLFVKGIFMLGVTLYEGERYGFLKDISVEQKEAVSYALFQKLKSDGIMERNEIEDKIKNFIENERVVDLEKELTVHYVNRNRDFSLFQPVDFSTIESAQPLLDALSRGDFEMAKHLTPENKRLCGFEFVSEDKKVTKYQEYAAYYDEYVIPAGVYPLFAESFRVIENYKGFDGPQYANELKDFQGLSIFTYGKHIGGNPVQDVYDSKVFESPYAHTVAEIALDKLDGSIQMIAPFLAVEQKFISCIDNQEKTTYGIIDSDIEDRVLIDPMKLKGGIDSMLRDGVFNVERLRGSVTQGEAAVYCNGQKIVQYGDEMWLRCNNGKLTNGHREIFNDLAPGNYGEIIGGWGSIRSDKHFVKAVIRQFPKEVEKALHMGERKLSLTEQLKDAENSRKPYIKDEIHKDRGQDR